MCGWFVRGKDTEEKTIAFHHPREVVVSGKPAEIRRFPGAFFGTSARGSKRMPEFPMQFKKFVPWQVLEAMLPCTSTVIPE